MNSVPIVCNLCLVGGGHSHVLLIRRWAMRPLPGVRLTLVSSDVRTPYSGMLPGLIAGHYTIDDIHIDLRRLCTWAGVRFIEQTMTALDLEQRKVRFKDRPALDFDVLSLDTGSTPDLSVDGSREHVTPVKPVHSFYARWQAILGRLSTPSSTGVSIGVVGSGAGGFELVSAMRYRLPEEHCRLHWFLMNDLPIEGRPPRVGQLALSAARRNGIIIHSGFAVTRVEQGGLYARDGRHAELDEILWCTAATGPAWPAAAGLSVDARGFVATNACLQSISHEFVFASGDIGTQVDSPSAKAGVYAVRQAPYLFENLRRHILGETLSPFHPQDDFLSLMATGGKRAIASRGALAVEADWVWRWKDHIDRRFMHKFSTLPPMQSNANLQRLPDALKARYGAPSVDGERAASMRCRGCGSKVGEPVLERVLERVPGEQAWTFPLAADAAISPAGDAALFDVQTGSLVQSVDHVDAIIDDPYLLGRIAALHALSDVATLDTTLHSAQVIASVPAGSSSVVEADLTQLMQGLVEVLAAEHCALIGGHTVEGDELSVGIVVNAVLQARSKPAADGDELSTHIQPGDVLILTQPLGTGTLFAGMQQQLGNGADISNALAHMLMSNTRAAKLLRESGARCMTDVTGFGLLGHLHRLLRHQEAGAAVYVNAVPWLAGSRQLAEEGVRSSLWPQNRLLLETIEIEATVDRAALALLCDPQTGGGLLAVVPAARQDACLAGLHGAGYIGAAMIGVTTASPALSVLP